MAQSGKRNSCQIAVLVLLGLAALAVLWVLRAIWYDHSPPERGIVAEGEVPRIDYDCAKRAFTAAFPDHHEMGAAAGRVPEGEVETLFNYYETADAWAVFAFFDTPKGSHVTHYFLGHGEKLPQSAFPPALAEMRKAEAALKRDCNVDLSSIPLKAKGQRVDALRN